MVRNKALLLITVLLIFITSSIPVSNVCAATANVTVKVDGQEVSFPDAQPYIDQNNRTLVPIRFVSQALGSSVSWDGNTRTVTINKNTDTVTIKIGEKRAFKNGQEKLFDTSASITQNRTFVPLRFIGEVLGSDVNWISSTRTVEISTGSRAGGTGVDDVYNYNGYIIPKDTIVDIDTRGDKDSIDIGGQILVYKDYTSRCDQLERILSSKFGSNTAKTVVDYCRTKQIRDYELPVKDFYTEDKYMIEVYSLYGDTSVSFLVLKPGKY